MEALLDFASLIKDKKSPHPLTILSVVPNNEMAEINLRKARKNLDSTVKYASGSQTDVSVMATIDHNIAGGISRASREVSADGILLGWPSEVGIIEKFVGEKAESILNQTAINIFMCHFGRSFVANNRIILFCPPMAEAEKGFGYWLNKIARLSQELTLPVQVVSDGRSANAIRDYIRANKLSSGFKFTDHEEWDDLGGLRDYVKPDDLVAFVSARQGGVSYRHPFDGIFKKLGKVYADNNRILIFPASRTDFSLDEYEDVRSVPLIQRIGKEIGNIWGRGKKES
jgi:hypothetical protein